MTEEKKSPFQWLMNIFEITWTLLKNTSRIWELARFEFSLQYRDSRLGGLWAILTPLMQISIYWLVFGIGLRGNANRDGYPYIVWLICGLTAWNYLSRCVLSGAGELRAKKGLISKIDIHPYLILASRELSLLLEHILMLIVMSLMLVANGWRPDRYAVNLIYYIFSSLCFSFALSTIFSALALLAADFRRFLGSAMRMMFFLSPTLWTPGNNLPLWFHILFRLNPFNYIVTGYRESLLYHQAFWTRPVETAVFWGITLILYGYGCQWQSRIYQELADFV